MRSQNLPKMGRRQSILYVIAESKSNASCRYRRTSRLSVLSTTLYISIVRVLSSYNVLHCLAFLEKILSIQSLGFVTVCFAL